MEDFSHVDWPTLVLGIFLGVPVAYVIGIIAHIHALRLTHFLDNRKLLQKHKTRKQALDGFNRIKAFREGKRDRYPFYIFWSSVAVIFAITASTLILIVPIWQAFLSDIVIAILLLFPFIFILLTLLFLIGIYETSRQIERFDTYKEEFVKRWGSIDGELGG